MYIQSLKIANIKAFEQLHLDFARPNLSGDARYAGLTFFVGGNSSGKSTLLKCLAMALSGPMIASQQLVTPAGWIRRSAQRGVIELGVRHDTQHDQFRTGGAPPADGFNVGLVFEADEPGATATVKAKGTRVRTADRGPWNVDAPGWLLGAYGPLRRLTGSSTDALRYALARGNLASCVTLFREDAALTESETWLKQEYSRGLQQREQNQPPSPLVGEVQELLNDGLLPSDFKITRITVDDVFMSTPNGGELPLRDLSDGCRSIYALILDIIHSMAAAYGPSLTVLSRSPSPPFAFPFSSPVVPSRVPAVDRASGPGLVRSKMVERPSWDELPEESRAYLLRITGASGRRCRPSSTTTPS